MFSKTMRWVLFLLIPFIFIACGGSRSDYFITQTGTLNDSKVIGIEYSCGSNSGITDANGQFSCRSDSDNIEFHIGAVSLGSIQMSNLKDFTIYPSDLVGSSRVDTNSSKVTNILQFLQSLDEDNNPYNGIVITQSTRDRLSRITSIKLDTNSTTQSDLNATVVAVGKKLIKVDYAVAHYEDTLRYEINSTVDTVAPAPAIASKSIYLTNADTTTVTIYGERNAKIFMDGNYSHIDIDNNHSATFELNTTGDDGYIYFPIKLQDSLDRMGDESNITILKDTTPPAKPTVSEVPNSTYNETISITIHGEEDAIVIIDGSKVGSIHNGSFQTNLNVGGEYGEKSFNISLMDLAGNESEATTIKTIFNRISLSESYTYYIPENFIILRRGSANENILILGYGEEQIIAGTVANLGTNNSLEYELNSIINSIKGVSNLTISEITRQLYTDSIVAEYSLHSTLSIGSVDLISLLVDAIMGNSLSNLPTSNSSITANDFNLVIKLVKDSSGNIHILLSVVPSNLSLEYQTTIDSLTNSQNIVYNAVTVEGSDSFIGNASSGNQNIAEFLFVVDDSGSMSAYQNAVSQASKDFANAIINAGVDFRIAIITTSSGIDYGSNYKSARRVLENIGIIENDIELFKENIIVGTGGSSTETAIYNAERALQPNGILTQMDMPYNKSLSIVILSDEVSQYSSRARGSFDVDDNIFLDKGYKVYSIINPEVASYSQYDDLATKTGGLIADISNTSSYSTIMNTIAQNAVGATGYKLSQSNIIETTITISINGQEIPHGNSRNGWRYMESYNRIIFYGTAIPNEGDEITINYSYLK
jgi:hypothetical protein